jgi:hypothetical protein
VKFVQEAIERDKKSKIMDVERIKVQEIITN